MCGILKPKHMALWQIHTFVPWYILDGTANRSLLFRVNCHRHSGCPIKKELYMYSELVKLTEICICS